MKSTALSLTIDCKEPIANVPAVWRSFGYDEINWTYTPRGKQIFREIARLSSEPYYIRCHHTFTTGNGLSTPTKGSGNVCGLNGHKQLVYDFTIFDQVLETFLNHNCKPIVELGFMPDFLSKGPKPKPTYDYSGSDLWMYPPKDFRQWADLVYETVRHCVEKFGEAEVRSWYWEVWNEPDNPGFFKGSVKDYCKIYDHAVDGAVRALPSIKIGGPALARSPGFLNTFLKHCVSGKNYATGQRSVRLDFISLHTKGTGWPLPEQPFEMPSLQTIVSYWQRYQEILQKYPSLKDTEILFDECDMAVATDYGVHDFPEYRIHNSEYYPIFVVRMAKRLLDFISATKMPVKLFTTWAFYLEGKRFFEGNRALFTNENIKMPIFNAFVMLEMLGETRLKMQINSFHERSFSYEEFPRIDGLATLDERRAICAIIWNFTENEARVGVENLQVQFKNLPVQWESVDVEFYRVCREFSNSHTVWQSLGASQDPDPEQIQKIKEKENLQQVEVLREVPISQSTLTHVLELPAQSMVLMKIIPVPAKVIQIEENLSQ
ncbi:MAG: hypothetical protein ACE5HS_13910 [bacterium]